jgi:hypothetical protein
MLGGLNGSAAQRTDHARDKQLARRLRRAAWQQRSPIVIQPVQQREHIATREDRRQRTRSWPTSMMERCRSEHSSGDGRTAGGAAAQTQPMARHLRGIRWACWGAGSRIRGIKERRPIQRCYVHARQRLSPRYYVATLRQLPHDVGQATAAP